VQLVTQMVFFLVIHVFLHLRCIGLFGTKRGNIHLETFKFQEVILSKTNTILTGRRVPDAERVNAGGFLSRDPCVPSTLLHTHTSNKISLSTP
jgi:hypothetical protein